jgi:hypothetical protein
MDTNSYLTQVFPDPVFALATDNTGVAVCSTEINGMTQHFVYGFESYAGSTVALHSGCFPSEVKCLTGIAQARLLSWDTPFDLTAF